MTPSPLSHAGPYTSNLLGLLAFGLHLVVFSFISSFLFQTLLMICLWAVQLAQLCLYPLIKIATTTITLSCRPPLRLAFAPPSLYCRYVVPTLSWFATAAVWRVLW